MTKNRERLRIVVISTVHETYDTRIFYKQILSLQSKYEIVYFSATLETPQYDWIIPLSKSRTKMGRLLTHLSLIRRLPRFKADLYLLHDPELLPLGILLKLFGNKVVWDMHEDTYSDIRTKTYVKPLVRSAFAFIYKLFQVVSYKLFDGFVLAEDGYRSYFGESTKTCIVHNYALLDQLNNYDHIAKEPRTIVYIGSISVNRGIYQLLDLVIRVKIEFPDIRLILIGPFSDDSLDANVQKYIRHNNIEDNVQIRGSMKNVEAYPVIAKCMIGLALLLPEPNFTKSLPTKMFEYMALGLPVVVSNFPRWEDIVKSHQAGVVVDPFDIASISEVVSSILANENLYAELSHNAKVAAQEYSWETESIILQNFLDNVLSKR